MSFPISWPHRLVSGLDAINLFIGKAVACLTLVMVIITCVVVVMRRVFNLGSIGLQESVTYMHAAVFMLGAAYALRMGAQVRVDVLYRRFHFRTRAWVDSLGALLFLLPVSLFIGFVSWDFVIASWQIREGSTDSGGLSAIYLLKTLIPLTAVSLSLQALAEILRNGLVLMGLAQPEAEQQEQEL
jgi:TRAP-type mannitol/chloroaromatic compound transport system permease small subunit